MTTANAATATATKKATVSVNELKAQIELAQLMQDIVNLTERSNELKKLLDDKKKRLAEILPEGGFRIRDFSDSTKELVAKWQEKETKTLQKALVEEHHGIVLTEADFKVTESRYPSVTKVKA